MNTYAVLFNVCLLAACFEARAADDNPVFAELLQKGVTMSDGKAYKLPAPAVANDLDAAGQLSAIEKISGGRYTYEDLVQKTSSAPVMIRIRTLKTAEGESATIRAIDVWFVAHGKWETLNSKDFLDSLAKGKDTEGENRIVSKSGFLTDEEMQKRNLKLQMPEGQEVKFVYATFSLFDQVEVSTTRYSVVTRGKNNLLVAGRIDPRFNADHDYPNQWRPILRDAAANISLGPPQLYTGAGAYANITRLAEPADSILVEGHIVFEEPYGWFEGGNELRSKAPTMIQQRAKIFRSKFGIASAKQQ
ncbi:MAG: hypothetical protein ABSA16_11000 [Thermoguttaceae bacterium]|jgi:hypothetical protein